MGECYIKKQQLRPMYSKMPIIFLNERLKSLSEGNTNLKDRKLERFTLKPEDIETILKRGNTEEYTNNLEKEELLELVY